MPTDRSVFARRRERARRALSRHGTAALLLAPGPDLAYLSGYRVFSSERMTCLVLTADAATLVVPALESPRASQVAADLPQRPWAETEDPYAAAAALVTAPGPVAVSDQMWALFVLELQQAMPARAFVPASTITRELRMSKDATEIAALRAAAAAADRAFTRVLETPFEGRREREVATDLAALLRAEGHDEVGFTIVASGSNGASPHHGAGERRIERGDAVVLDFGGTKDWYCSDITRTVHVGEPSEAVVRVHDVVRRAQEAGYAAARSGASAASVDAAARAIIADAGYGERFIHRLGHGIGLEGHEHPYLVSGNEERLAPGMSFSIEPGIYLPGRFGVRIEDIAFIAEDGRAEPLNTADHALAIVR